MEGDNNTRNNGDNNSPSSSSSPFSPVGNYCFNWEMMMREIEREVPPSSLFTDTEYNWRGQNPIAAAAIPSGSGSEASSTSTLQGGEGEEIANEEEEEEGEEISSLTTDDFLSSSKSNTEDDNERMTEEGEEDLAFAFQQEMETEEGIQPHPPPPSPVEEVTISTSSWEQEEALDLRVRPEGPVGEEEEGQQAEAGGIRRGRSKRIRGKKGRGVKSIKQIEKEMAQLAIAQTRGMQPCTSGTEGGEENGGGATPVEPRAGTSASVNRNQYQNQNLHPANRAFKIPVSKRRDYFKKIKEKENEEEILRLREELKLLEERKHPRYLAGVSKLEKDYRETLESIELSRSTQTKQIRKSYLKEMDQIRKNFETEKLKMKNAKMGDLREELGLIKVEKEKHLSISDPWYSTVPPVTSKNLRSRPDDCSLVDAVARTRSVISSSNKSQSNGNNGSSSMEEKPKSSASSGPRIVHLRATKVEIEKDLAEIKAEIDAKKYENIPLHRRRGM